MTTTLEMPELDLEQGDDGSDGDTRERPKRFGRVRRRLARVRKRTWVILSIIAVLIIGGATAAIVWAATRPSTEAPVTQTSTVSLETMEKSVESSGTLSPTVQEDANFVASGTVTSVDVEAGDTVREGQRLATVDALQTNADLLQARADLADAEAQLASAQEEADGSAASDARIAARESAVSVASESVANAETASDGITLRAPVAGLVTAVSLEVGDAVTGDSGSTSGSSLSQTGSGGSGTSGGTGGSSGSGMPGAGSSTGSSASSSSDTATAQFTIVGTDSWSVSVSLSETEVGLIEVDDQVELETEDGTKLFGVVSEIGKLPSTSSGTPAYPVAVDITGDTEGLFDGTEVTATIIYERRTEVLTVPSAAITTADDGTATVTRVDADGNETEQQVTVGEVSGNLTEITEGLSEGDQVIVTVFTPGEGNSGGRGQMPDFGNGEMPDFGGGEMPDFGNGEMPDFSQMGGGNGGGFPGGGRQ
ncbi:MAG: efflux RND transporter periplasmic adaptor subunit [Leucobacter sp.]